MTKEKLLLIIQIVLMYATQVSFFLVGISGIDIFLWILIIVGLLSLIIGLINVIFGVINIFRGQKNPLVMTLVCKIILIPWYIINFVIWALLVVGFMNPFLILGIPILLVIGISFTYMYMICTSSLNISYAFNLIKNKAIKNKPLLIVSMIFHFILCLDVVGSIMIFGACKEKNEQIL